MRGAPKSSPRERPANSRFEAHLDQATNPPLEVCVFRASDSLACDIWTQEQKCPAQEARMSIELSEKLEDEGAPGRRQRATWASSSPQKALNIGAPNEPAPSRLHAWQAPCSNPAANRRQGCARDFRNVSNRQMVSHASSVRRSTASARAHPRTHLTTTSNDHSPAGIASLGELETEALHQPFASRERERFEFH